MRRYVLATGDEDFERDYGTELLVETARLWMSLGHHEPDGSFRIDGVTGPDEYSALVDNNVYTNLMAQANLRAAAEAAERRPDCAARSTSTERDRRMAGRGRADVRALRRAARRASAGPGLHRATSAGTSTPRRADDYPLLLTARTSSCTAGRWSSRPTSCWLSTCAAMPSPPEQKRRDFDYYEALTVRDSSLSACIQSVVAAEVGHLDLAYDYLAEAALMDLDDLEHNVRDGVHVASLGGAVLAVIAGFGGVRDHGGELSFAPRLPAGLARLAFPVVFRGRHLQVEVTPSEASYRLREGTLQISHWGERIELGGGAPVARPIPPAPSLPAPAQPAGRAPARRRART